LLNLWQAVNWPNQKGREEEGRRKRERGLGEGSLGSEGTFAVKKRTGRTDKQKYS